MVIKMYKECIDCGKRPENCKCKNTVFRKVFEHAPRGIPTLTEEEAREFEKQIARPPSKQQIETFKRAREVYEGIMKVEQGDKVMKYSCETIDTEDGHKWIYDWKAEEWIDVEPSPKLKKLIAEGRFIRIR